MILGSLYENSVMTIASFKNITPEDNFLIGGPFWLLQLWLNTIFDSFFNGLKPDEDDESIKNKSIEATCMVFMTPTILGVRYNKTSLSMS